MDVVCDGQTLLDASLAAGIPHYHVCGGLARCSTCRVTVIDGALGLGARTAGEIELASTRRWPDTMRLACQCRPTGNAKVRRVIADDIDADMAARDGRLASRRGTRYGASVLRHRGIYEITEHQLAYDVGIPQPLLQADG